MTPGNDTWLAIETATDVCAVGLMHNEQCYSVDRHEARAHAREMMDLIDQLLAEAALDLAAVGGIVVGHGPGSFTGVRIAIALTQGLAKGLNVPVLGISSLQIIAQVAARDSSAERIVVAQDARMQEIYAGCFERDASGLMQPVGGDQLLAPTALSLQAGDLLVGTATGEFDSLAALAQARGVVVGAACQPDSPALLQLARAYRGDWQSPDALRPAYLRDEVAARPRQTP